VKRFTWEYWEGYFTPRYQKKAFPYFFVTADCVASMVYFFFFLGARVASHNFTRNVTMTPPHPLPPLAPTPPLCYSLSRSLADSTIDISQKIRAISQNVLAPSRCYAAIFALACIY